MGAVTQAKPIGYNTNRIIVINTCSRDTVTKLPRVPFVNYCQFYVFSYFPFGFEGRMWDLTVSVPDHCLSFYFDSIVD